MFVSGGHDVVFIDGSDKLPPRIKKGLPSYHTKQAKPPIYKEYFNMINILYFALNGEFNSLNNRLPLVAGMMDNRVLSKSTSGQASRYSLAFFAPKYRLTSQVTDIDSATHRPKLTGVNRHIMPALAAVYDGVTLQNSPFWVICRAVSSRTESEPHHPMTFHSVVITQKLLGGYHA